MIRLSCAAAVLCALFVSGGRAQDSGTEFSKAHKSVIDEWNKKIAALNMDDAVAVEASKWEYVQDVRARLIDKFPDYSESQLLRMTMAGVCAEIRRWDAASAFLEEGLKRATQPDAVVAFMNMCAQMDEARGEITRALERFRAIVAQFPDTLAGEQARAAIARLDLVGRAAPDFSVKTFDGKDLKLSDLKGGAVLLWFWGAWDETAAEVSKTLKTIHSKHEGDGLRVVAVNAHDSAQGEAMEAIVQNGLAGAAWHNVRQENCGVKLTALFQVREFPSVIVIGKDGKIRSFSVGVPPDLDERISTALK